jgi:hypothetical protein
MEESQKGTPVEPPRKTRSLRDWWPGLIPLIGTPAFVALMLTITLVLMSALVTRYQDRRPFAFLSSPLEAPQQINFPVCNDCGGAPAHVAKAPYAFTSVSEFQQPVLSIRDSRQHEIVSVDQNGHVAPGAGVPFDVAMRTFCGHFHPNAAADQRAQAEKLLAMANAKLEVAERLLLTKPKPSYVCIGASRADKSACYQLAAGQTLELAPPPCSPLGTNAVPYVSPSDFYRNRLEDLPTPLDLVHKP